MSLKPDHPTFPEPHRILMTARNPQGLARLRDEFHPLLEGDPRLHPAWSVLPGSTVEHAAHRFLRELDQQEGAHVIHWDRTPEYDPALVISCSPSPDLFQFGAPVITMSHGAGNNRYRTDLSGPYGLAPEQLLEDADPSKRRTVDWLPLAGPAALEELRRSCPESVAAAEIVGDLTLERLRHSRIKRTQYRRALGLEPGQVLIVVTSTWGDGSLVGQGHVDLLARLLSTLPTDVFKVAFIPHPNIENGRGGSIVGVLAPWLRNSLMMPEPHGSWRPLLVAGDLFIGDSGSVLQYSAALERPVLLAAFGFDQMPEDAALAEFGRTAPWLDLDKPLKPQLLEALDGGGGEFDRILARGLSPDERFTAKVYELLRIPPVAPPEPLLLPEPVLHHRSMPCNTWRFTIRVNEGLAEWERSPVSVPEEARGLVVTDAEACFDRLLMARADVLLLHRTPLAPAVADDEIDDFLDRCPHSGIVSVRTGVRELRLGIRRGPRVAVRCEPELMEVLPPALHAWLSEQSPNSVALDAPDAFEDFQRRFQPPPSLFAA